MFLVVLASCNKDNEIVIDNPGYENNDAVSGQPTVEEPLSYKVLEYIPAPGQFINEKQSGFDAIETHEQACLQAEKRLASNLYVSLGAWGGYIVVKFNKPVTNSGSYDFSILGNAFEDSNEPGIVWVMQDSNGNGLADDEWKELKGSYYGCENYRKDYEITYYRPSDEQSDTPWTDIDGSEGQVKWMGSYHSQPYYYPSWVKEDSYTLKGSLMPDTSVFDEETGFWTTGGFEWGYADNTGRDMIKADSGGLEARKNFFRISDAVNADGTEANLSRIDFIKVQTAVISNRGWLGECSTEVCGFFVENAER